MGSRRPRFSIVLPTYRRPEQLATCLQALARQDYPRDDFEVIVVDDGSGAPPEEGVASLRGALDITLLAEAHAGPASARNAGAARAKGEFLAFTDDDCAPAPDWLRTLGVRFSKAPDRGVGGSTLNALPDNPYSTGSQLLMSYLYEYYNSDPDRARFFASNNVAFPADRFRALGGFDTTFRHAGGEDREFCDRWLFHGYEIIYAPEARVYHTHPLTLRTFCRQHFNYGRGAVRFHAARARRLQDRMRLEPLSFYLDLVRYPFSHAGGRLALWLTGLMVASQAANAAGFWWERRQQARRQRRLIASASPSLGPRATHVDSNRGRARKLQHASSGSLLSSRGRSKAPEGADGNQSFGDLMESSAAPCRPRTGTLITPHMLGGRPVRRLLFLLPFAPRLDATHGGGRVMAQFITRLATRHDIALLCLRADDEPPIDHIVRERCKLVEEVVRPSVSHSLVQRGSRRLRLVTSLLCGTPMWVTDWAVATYRERVRVLTRTWQPDVVQIEYHIMGQYLSALDGCPAPRVLTEHEAGAKTAHDLWQSYRGFARLMRYLDMRAWNRFERALIGAVQAVVVFTERDRQALAQFARPTPITRIPLGTPLPEHPLNPVGCPPPSVLFVGNFMHPPNVDAALRLINAIFPRVQTRVPEAMLHIVGDRPTAQMRRMSKGNVVVTGHVPDLTSYLDRAAVVVAPLRLGGGMRVKVLEALAAGKAVVASPLAIEGVDVVDGEHVLLAENDEEFCNAIVQLLVDVERRALLAARARAWACANLSWQDPIAAYEALYDAVLERSSRATQPK